MAPARKRVKNLRGGLAAVQHLLHTACEGDATPRV
jgi:hypothetical protein